MVEKMVHEDQKQRSLAALERRFAAAKAEIDLNHNKLMHTHSKPACLRKGNYTFVGHAASEDFHKSGSTYLTLPQSIDENLITFNSSDGKVSKVDNFLDQIFRNGDAGQKYTQGSRSLKIDNWVLLDNYVQGRSSVSTGPRLRARRSHSKRSKKHMSMKQHKNNGALDLPKELHKYKLFFPVHEHWKNMMAQDLKKIGVNQLAQHFMDIDLHGALLSVVECKTASLTGLGGIMIRETAETFGILTRDDKFRVVPKKCSVFICQFDTWKVTLLGDKLTSRNTTGL